MNHQSSIVILLLFLVALFVRVMVVFSLPEIHVSSDSKEYIALADSIAEDGSFSLYGRAHSMRTPGYPLLLSVIRMFSESPRVIALMQAFISALNVVLVYLIAYRLFDRLSALLAAFVVCFDPGSLLAVTSVLSETLFIFFVLIAVFIFNNPRFSLANYHPFVGGLLIGFAALVRPIAQWLFIPFVIILLFRSKSKKMVFSFLIGILLIQGTWVIRNYYHYQRIYFSEISAGSLYIAWATPAEALAHDESIRETVDTAYQVWNKAIVETSPPEIIDMFQKGAYEKLSNGYPYLPLVFFKGVTRQIVDSSSLTLISRFDPDASYRINMLVRRVMSFESAQDCIISFGILILRLMELLIILCIFILAAFAVGNTILKSSKSHLDLWFVIIPVIYLFILSSGITANQRFRQQYLAFAVILAAPSLVALIQQVWQWWRKGSKVQHLEP